MLMAIILYHKKIRKYIEVEGYQVNSCDICASNKTRNGKKHALEWQADDAKASHVDSKANEKFHKWTEKKCGSDELGHVTVTSGKRYDYLGMMLDFTKKHMLA